METQIFEVEVPAYIMSAIHQTGEELTRQMKTLTAINLYRTGDISLEMAAEFAESSKWDFEELLSKNKIPISLLDIDDYKEELNVISNL